MKSNALPIFVPPRGKRIRPIALRILALDEYRRKPKIGIVRDENNTQPTRDLPRDTSKKLTMDLTKLSMRTKFPLP